MKDVGQGMTDIGKTMTAGISLPLAGIGVAAFKASTDLNASMANVATLVPDNIKRIQELKQNVQDMSVQFGKSSADISDGLYQVISTFGDTADTSKILADNVKAAAAGMATTTDAINLTAAVSKGYNDTSEKTIKHITDLAFQTANLGITTFPELSKSIGGVTPLAATLGIKMEDMFAVFATGAGITGDTSQVATQFQNILQGLMAPTTAMAGLMKKLGFANGEAMLKSLGLQGTINKIVDTAKKANVPLQNYIGSIDGQTLALALNGNLAQGFTSNLKAMGDVAGSTDKAFQQQTQGINKTGFAWEQLKQKAMVSMQQLGDVLGPIFLNLLTQLDPLIKKLQDFSAFFAKLSPNVQTVIVAVLAFIAALGPLLVIFGTIVTAIGTLMPVFEALGEVIALVISGALLPIIAVLAALVAIGVLVYKNWETVKAYALQIWGAIVAFVQPLIAGMVTFINGKMAEMRAFWSKYGAEIMQIVNIMWSVIQVYFSTALQIIIAAVRVAWEAIKGAVTIGMDVIKGVISVAWDVIKGIFSIALDLIKGNWQGAWNDLKSMVKSIFDDIVGTIENVGNDFFNAGKGLIDQIVKGIENAASAAYSAIQTVAGKIRDFLPFSPAKVGPLSDLDKLDFGGPITDSIKGALPNVQKMMTGLVTLPNISTASNMVMAGGNQPIVLEMDGRQVARGIMPHATNEIRQKTGIKFN
jgi:TP901 family phage tail tape measure protein